MSRIPCWRNGVIGAGLLSAALACAVVALPAAPARAGVSAPPEDQAKSGQPQAKKSTGPRRMKLGGTRSEAAKKMKGLGQAKLPIKSLNNPVRGMKIGLGGVRSRPAKKMSGLPRARVPDLLPPRAQRAPRDETPRPAMTQDQVRAALLSGGRSNRAFERSMREHGFGDVEVGPRIRFQSGGEGPTSEQMESIRAAQDLVSRGSVAPGTVAVLNSMIVPANGQIALEVARKEYGERGYTEIELGRGDVGFVKTTDPAKIRAIRDQLGCIRGKANAFEQEREWDLRRHYNRWMDDDDIFYPARVVSAEGAGGSGGGGVDPFLQYGAAGAPESTEPRPGFDAAVAAIGEGMYERAAEELGSYLSEEPEDMEVVRLLGIVQLLGGEIAAGIETVGAAYEMDPFLASRPIGSELLTGRSGDLRRALSAAVGQAHRTQSARAWLTAAVLMHAEGRPEQAVKMVERAVSRGLDGAVGDEMMFALRP